jgi:OPT family oligopeptide transporter
MLSSFPVWALFLAVASCIILQVPIGIVYAATNVELYNNVLAEFIAGYALPSKPIANMIFKAYGIMGCLQSVSYSQDLKLGHYLKVPPRVMFVAQVYATVLATFVAVGVNAWQMANIKDFCQPTQKDHFTCPGNNTFFSAAVLWGVVGPKRLFGSSGLYGSLLWAFLIGAILPIPFWLIARRHPNSMARYIHLPVIIIGASYLSPYNLSFVWPACIFGFIFNFWIKRHHLVWWEKYAYVLTTSFRAAIAVAAIVIFLAVQLHDAPITWWGNTVSFSGVDGGGQGAPSCVLRTLSEGERIGSS